MRAGFYLRAMLRESRGSRGRLVFFTLCLAIGVAAVVAVTGLVDTIEGGIYSRSRELMAADLCVESRRPLPAELDEFVRGISDARRADVREMATMISTLDGVSRIAQLKVVEGPYPFYGDLVLEPAVPLQELLTERTAVVDPGLLEALELDVGGTLRLGGAEFEIAGIVRREPDRLDFIGVMGPRVFLSTEGLRRTELTGFGARVRYRALLKITGDSSPYRLARLKRRMERELPGADYLKVQSHHQAQPAVRRAIERLEDYVGLVALLSLVLGGIGVAQIVRAWLAGRTQAVAVLRCLGLRPREILVLFLGHIALLALAGSIVGGLAGCALVPLVASIQREVLPPIEFGFWQPLALLKGALLGLGIAGIFSLPPLTAIWRVAPARVLRAEVEPLAQRPLVRRLAALALLAGVLLSARAQGGSWINAGVFTVGLFVLGGLLALGARLVMRLSGRLPRERLSPYLRHGLAALARPGAGTTGAVVALGLGVMVVLSMYLVETRMSDGLVKAMPEDAPTVFMMGIQPQQWEALEDALEEADAGSIDRVPMVTARITSVDGTPVEDLAGRRGLSRWGLTREQRLTSRRDLSADNRLVDGALWTDPDRPEISIEERFARRLGVSVGSRIVFDVQGVPLELSVTSIRAVDWQSFGINFFLVVEPGVLDDAPRTLLTAARLPPGREQAFQDRVAAEFPGVTVLRVRAIVERVGGLLRKMSVGVRLLGGFTVLAGIAILAGAISSSHLRRGREAALLKTLGVTRRGVTVLFATEYGLHGLIAGLIGSAGALALAWAFLEKVVKIGADIPVLAIPVATAATVLVTVLSGIAASARAIQVRPMESLRG